MKNEINKTREQNYLQQSIHEWTKENPIMQQIGLDDSTNPISVLMEGFSELISNIESQIDKQPNKIAKNLLGLLYPNLNYPLPAQGVVEIVSNAGQYSGTLPKNSKLNFRIDRNNYHFRTCYDLELWPIDVSRVSVVRNTHPHMFHNEFCLKLELKLKPNFVHSPSHHFTKLHPPKIKIFVNTRNYNKLFAAMFSNNDKCGILHDDGNITYATLRPLGFEENETILPLVHNRELSTLILKEYFAYPDKFSFFEIINTDWSNLSEKVDIYIPLSNLIDARELDLPTFHTNVVPIVNLFNKSTEPFKLDYTKRSYPLTLDYSRNCGIYCIERVLASEGYKTQEIPHYLTFDIHHEHSTFWVIERNAEESEFTESLSFVDKDFEPSQQREKVIYAEALAYNKDLESQHIDFNKTISVNVAGLDAKILKPFTKIQNANTHALWNLIAVLGHASLDAATSFLKIYGENKGSEDLYIESIDKAVRMERQIIGNWKGFVPTDVFTINLKKEFAEEGFLLARVLSKFLQLETDLLNNYQSVIMCDNVVWHQS